MLRRVARCTPAGPLTPRTHLTQGSRALVTCQRPPTGCPSATLVELGVHPNDVDEVVALLMTTRGTLDSFEDACLKEETVPPAMNSYDDTTTPTGDPATVVPADLLQRILTDAAQRTGAPRSSVRAVGVTAGDTLLDYRTSGTRHFRVCPPDTRADD